MISEPVKKASSINDPHIAHFNVKVNGAQLPAAPMNDLIECVVENSLHLPDMCTIRIEDHQFQWLDSAHFQEGNPVVIEAGEGTGPLTPIFHGEVVSLEMDLAAHGIATLVVRCFDRSHRLHRGREARSFVNVTDTDIVKKIGTELGFKVIADATTQVHDWVLQNNQTNWEFLTERAARNGFRLYVQGEKNLYFKKVQDKGDANLKIEWGKELRSFRPRTSAASQVDEVVVKGWDPKTKSPIIGKAKAPRGIPQTARTADGGKLAKRAFGAARMTVVDRPVHSTAEAESLAQSIRDEIAGAFLEADGLCFALPKLKPGMTVEIPNIGKRFSGEYYVTTTTHTYTPSEGYATQFAVSGKHPATLLSVLGTGTSSRGTRSPVGGNIVVGIVTDNRDPEGLGRVKVKYPWLTEDHTSFWARQSSQMGGGNRGMFNIPELDDEVLVAFEHGDISRPFLLGQLWNTKDKPPGLTGARTQRTKSPASSFSGKDGDALVAAKETSGPSNNPMIGGGGEVNRRGYYSRIGHLLDFDDTGGAGGVILKSKSGNHVDVSDADQKVEIKTKGGHMAILDDSGQKIELKTTSGHTITMSDAGNNISITDNAGDNITMVMGAISITALLAVSIQAPMIALNAAVMLTGEAPVVNFNSAVKGRFTSYGTITLDSTADMNVTSGTSILTKAGADIKTEAGANMDLKATTIKMNS